MLARALLDVLPERGHEVIALDRRGLDVTDAAGIGQTLAAIRPHAVLHCAAYADVDGSEAREEYARLVNAESTLTLARACDAIGARLVYPSTDYVFDGSATRPYRPDDVPRPINAYGRTKLLGERATRISKEGIVVRIAWLYGPERRGFIRGVIEHARRFTAGQGAPLRIVADQVGRPTSTGVAANAIAGLLERRAPAGTYHATGSGPEVSRYDLARAALELAELGDVPVEPVSSEEFAAPAPRPRWSVLDLASTEAVIGPLPDWRETLGEAVRSGQY